MTIQVMILTGLRAINDKEKGLCINFFYGQDETCVKKHFQHAKETYIRLLPGYKTNWYICRAQELGLETERQNKDLSQLNGYKEIDTEVNAMNKFYANRNDSIQDLISKDKIKLFPKELEEFRV